MPFSYSELIPSSESAASVSDHLHHPSLRKLRCRKGQTNFCSLRKHPETLTLLKEKLTVLWGNLGELKDKHVLKGGTEPFNADGLTSLPFYCCVYEYGVKRSQLELDYEDGVASYETNPETFFGWERRFAMHGTTIQT